MKKGRSYHGAPIVFLLLVGFFLRVWRLGVQSLWYDETVSAYLASQPLPALIHHTSLDIHPPLYYILLRFWTLLTGRSEFALGFFSGVFGWIHIPLVYMLGREVGGKKLGALSAAVITFSTFDVWYSQEVRMYALGSTLGLIGLIALVKAMKGARSSMLPAVWSVTGILGMYTLYYFGFLLVSEGVILLVWIAVNRARGLSLAKKWLAAMIAIPVAYIPWAPIAWRQATNPPVPPWRSFVGLWKTISTAWTALCLGQSVKPEDVAPVLAILFILYLAGVWKLARNGNSGLVVLLLVGYTFLPLFIIYLISLEIPLYHPRYMALYAAPFSVLLGGGLCFLLEYRRVGEALSALAMALLVVVNGYSLYNFHFDPLYASDDYRSGVGLIERQWAPGDAVLINAGYVYTAFDYYFHDKISWQGKLRDYYGCHQSSNGIVVVETGTIDGPPELGWGHPEADFYSISPTEAGEKLALLFKCHPRVWQLRAYDTVTDPKGFIRTWLKSNSVLLWDVLLTGETNARVQAWRIKFHSNGSTSSKAVYPDAGLELEGWRMSEKAKEGNKAGGVLLVRARGTSRGQKIGFSVRLVGKEGSTWAQQDFSPEGNVRPLSDWVQGEEAAIPVSLRVPFGTPPGHYRLVLVVYDRKTGRPFTESKTRRALLDLGSFDVILPTAWPGKVTGWPVHPGISGGGVSLYGVKLDLRQEVKAGGRIPFEMLWRLSDAPSVGEARLFMLDHGGKEVFSRNLPIPGDGKFVRTKGFIQIPGFLRNGKYGLYLQLLGVNGKPLMLRKWGFVPVGKRWQLGKLHVKERVIDTKVPPLKHMLSDKFGGWGMLLGYDLKPEVPARRGDSVTIKLYWRSIAGTDKDYKVFVHLLDPRGKLVSQSDSYPNGGRLPTSAWVTGEVIEDKHVLKIPTSAVPGMYSVEVGMYLESTGVRVQVTGPAGEDIGDHVTFPLEVR